ncbi:MAG: ATP-binding cassette domain-containing protein, partial [Candidatus Margulisiibacteriota bacterium]
MSLIELQSISKIYAAKGAVPVKALDNVSLKIEAGEFLAIMGASGSGKSTLLAVLGLLDQADQGDYFLLGKNIARLPENNYAILRNRFFGFVFQSFNLLPKLNVLENTLLPFIYDDGVSPADHTRALDLLKKIGLENR